ncbi:Fc receptor-like protein 3 [Passerculus sandwichensis]
MAPRTRRRRRRRMRMRRAQEGSESSRPARGPFRRCAGAAPPRGEDSCGMSEWLRAPRPSASLLLVDSPWRPAVLWDEVTLTCQGSGTAGGTTWYKDGKWWWPKGPDHFTVTKSGTYECDRPDTGRSPPVTVSDELFTVPVLVLEGPPELTEGSPLTLSCLSTPSPLRPPAPLLYLFYRDGWVVGGPQGSPQLLLPAVGVSHSGNYSCEAQTQFGTVRKSSARLRVTVRSPLSFSWHREGSGALLGTGPRLELGYIGDNDSGQYRCRVSDGDSVAESDTMNVTVLVPVVNATVTLCPVHTGDNVTLRCSVQVGSAPVTFTWLHNGLEVAQGPLLEFGDIAVGHSGTWQCVATNQLGQDGHPVAAGVGSSLLALVLLGAAIVGWQRCHRRAPRTPQDRTPVVPHEGEEVLYSHVVPTARAAGSPSATPEEPQVTYAELRAPRWHPGDSGDYENVL